MKLARNAIFSLILVVIALVAVSSRANVYADEVNLRNITGETARCTVYSVLMQDSNYNLLLDCRDILYPGGSSVFSYVLWAVPSDGGNQFRLGTIDFGKNFFKTRTAFNALYITKETNSNTRTPTGPIIMQGSVQRNEFLDGPAPTPNPNELGSPSPTPIATPAPRNLGSIFAAGGVLAFLAIFGVILVIFVITRK